MSVDEDDDAKIPPLPSDAVVQDLRGSAVQCRELLHRLSVVNNAATYELEDMTAAFNILAANMGIFRQGEYSLASRLQNFPEISSLVKQLLEALQRHLGDALDEGDSGNGPRHHHVASSSCESDDSSDRSAVVSGRLDISNAVEEEEIGPTGHGPSAALTSARGTINSLRQLSLTLRFAGAQHRSQRIQRFRTHATYSHFFGVIRQRARESAERLFPVAPPFLLDRIAESIASRRIRFLYLKRHQMKISTPNQPAPALSPMWQQQGSIEKPATKYAAPSEPPRDLPQPSITLSTTEATALEPKGMRVHSAAHLKTEPAESVSSTQGSRGKFPEIPNADPGGRSFTCPYCLLVCPIRDAGHAHYDTLTAHQDATAGNRRGAKRLGKDQWRNHLIHDFEPFFCVFEDCSSPFACADTYSGWVAHLKEKHSPPIWPCWYCGPEAAVSFPSSGGLEGHLQEHYGHEVSDAHISALVKHSMTRKQDLLQSCVFCGGFPEDIEQRFPDRQSSQAQEALIAHVKDHLISVALILLPARAEETDDDDPGGDANSNLAGFSDIQSSHGTSEEHDVVDVVCRRPDCDCKTSSQVPSHDVPAPTESISGWDLNDAHLVAAINETWLDVKKQKRDDELDETDWLEQPVIKALSQSLQKAGPDDQATIEQWSHNMDSSESLDDNSFASQVCYLPSHEFDEA